MQSGEENNNPRGMNARKPLERPVDIYLRPFGFLVSIYPLSSLPDFII
jgi:hypothetical protein